MQPLRTLQVLALSLSTLTFSAQSAEIQVKPGDFPHERYVSIKGKITPGDFEMLQKKSLDALQAGSTPLKIYLDSAGGQVDEALKIGQFIRSLMATTIVHGKYIYTEGSPWAMEISKAEKKFSTTNSSNSVAVPSNASVNTEQLTKCASACVLIFYGGVERHVSDNVDARLMPKTQKLIPTIGLHRPHFDNVTYGALSPKDAEIKYAKLEKLVKLYLTDSGAPQSIIERIFRTSSTKIDWIPSNEFEKLSPAEAPFFEEWQISKCGAYGAAAALNQEEAQSFKSFKPGSTAAKYNLLLEKIENHNANVHQCRSIALRQYQTQRLKDALSSTKLDKGF